MPLQLVLTDEIVPFETIRIEEPSDANIRRLIGRLDGSRYERLSLFSGTKHFAADENFTAVFGNAAVQIVCLDYRDGVNRCAFNVQDTPANAGRAESDCDPELANYDHRYRVPVEYGCEAVIALVRNGFRHDPQVWEVV